MCWLVLGSLIINRLFFLEMLPAALVPTLAIELAIAHGQFVPPPPARPAPSAPESARSADVGLVTEMTR